LARQNSPGRAEWQAGKARLTLPEALEDLGYFWGLFATFVGAPSILTLFQMIFVEHRLIPALQWIVDSWNELMALLGAAVEPVLQPLVDWINAQFDWSLTLDPVWRPLFTLGLVFAMAAFRAAWPGAKSAHIARAAVVSTFFFGVTGFCALAGAVAASLIPNQSVWWSQGLIAAAPTTMFVFGAGLGLTGGVALVSKWGAAMGTFVVFCVASLVFGLIAFAVAATLSFIPAIAHGAGLLGLCGLVLANGLIALRGGLRRSVLVMTRAGLITLGGFMAAGLILIADVVVKMVPADCRWTLVCGAVAG
jgi:hypothetical protein